MVTWKLARTTCQLQYCDSAALLSGEMVTWRSDEARSQKITKPRQPHVRRTRRFTPETPEGILGGLKGDECGGSRQRQEIIHNIIRFSRNGKCCPKLTREQRQAPSILVDSKKKWFNLETEIIITRLLSLRVNLVSRSVQIF